jgi:SAM-dependent methyltransferase
MKLETERDAVEWLSAARALAVVSAWTSLGLFERLRAGPLRIEELDANRRALVTTIPVLMHVGLLAGDGERIALTPAAEHLLRTGTMPSNLGMLRDLSRMAEVLREGGPVRDDEGRKQATRNGTVPEDPAETERFLDMLYRLSEDPAKSTFGWLAPSLGAGASVLDLGGGHGRYARVFADAGFAVTLFDQPIVVRIAEKRHGDKLRYLEGDYHVTSSFGGPYDLVLLSNILYSEAPAQNASLLERAARSLRPGGRLAVRDMFLDEHGHDPSSTVFFGITALLLTEHGQAPTVREVRDWYASAGLVDFTLISTGTHQIAVARRR